MTFNAVKLLGLNRFAYICRMAERNYYLSDWKNRVACSCCSVELRVENVDSDVENMHRILPVACYRDASSNGNPTIPPQSGMLHFFKHSILVVVNK